MAKNGTNLQDSMPTITLSEEEIRENIELQSLGVSNLHRQAFLVDPFNPKKFSLEALSGAVRRRLWSDLTGIAVGESGEHLVGARVKEEWPRLFTALAQAKILNGQAAELIAGANTHNVLMNDLATPYLFNDVMYWPTFLPDDIASFWPNKHTDTRVASVGTCLQATVVNSVEGMDFETRHREVLRQDEQGYYHELTQLCCVMRFSSQQRYSWVTALLAQRALRKLYRGALKQKLRQKQRLTVAEAKALDGQHYEVDGDSGFITAKDQKKLKCPYVALSKLYHTEVLALERYLFHKKDTLVRSFADYQQQLAQLQEISQLLKAIPEAVALTSMQPKYRMALKKNLTEVIEKKQQWLHRALIERQMQYLASVNEQDNKQRLIVALTVLAKIPVSTVVSPKKLQRYSDMLGVGQLTHWRDLMTALTEDASGSEFSSEKVADFLVVQRESLSLDQQLSAVDQHTEDSICMTLALAIDALPFMVGGEARAAYLHKKLVSKLNTCNRNYIQNQQEQAKYQTLLVQRATRDFRSITMAEARILLCGELLSKKQKKVIKERLDSLHALAALTDSAKLITLEQRQQLRKRLKRLSSDELRKAVSLDVGFAYKVVNNKKLLTRALTGLDGSGQTALLKQMLAARDDEGGNFSSFLSVLLRSTQLQPSLAAIQLTKHILQPITANEHMAMSSHEQLIIRRMNRALTGHEEIPVGSKLSFDAEHQVMIPAQEVSQDKKRKGRKAKKARATLAGRACASYTLNLDDGQRLVAGMYNYALAKKQIENITWLRWLWNYLLGKRQPLHVTTSESLTLLLLAHKKLWHPRFQYTPGLFAWLTGRLWPVLKSSHEALLYLHFKETERADAFSGSQDIVRRILFGHCEAGQSLRWSPEHGEMSQALANFLVVLCQKDSALRTVIFGNARFYMEMLRQCDNEHRGVLLEVSPRQAINTLKCHPDINFNTDFGAARMSKLTAEERAQLYLLSSHCRDYYNDPYHHDARKVLLRQASPKTALAIVVQNPELVQCLSDMAISAEQGQLNIYDKLALQEDSLRTKVSYNLTSHLTDEERLTQLLLMKKPSTKRYLGKLDDREKRSHLQFAPPLTWQAWVKTWWYGAQFTTCTKTQLRQEFSQCKTSHLSLSAVLRVVDSVEDKTLRQKLLSPQLLYGCFSHGVADSPVSFYEEAKRCYEDSSLFRKAMHLPENVAFMQQFLCGLSNKHFYELVTSSNITAAALLTRMDDESLCRRLQDATGEELLHVLQRFSGTNTLVDARLHSLIASRTELMAKFLSVDDLQFSRFRGTTRAATWGEQALKVNVSQTLLRGFQLLSDTADPDMQHKLLKYCNSPASESSSRAALSESLGWVSTLSKPRNLKVTASGPFWTPSKQRAKFYPAMRSQCRLQNDVPTYRMPSNSFVVKV